MKRYIYTIRYVYRSASYTHYKTETIVIDAEEKKEAEAKITRLCKFSGVGTYVEYQNAEKKIPKHLGKLTVKEME